MPGIIALDSTVAFNRENSRITAPITGGRFRELHSEFIRRFIDDRIERITDWIAGRGVLGIIFHDHHLRLDQRDGWWLASLTFTVPLVPAGTPARALMDHFDTLYKSGLPT